MQSEPLRRFPHVPSGTGETYNVIGELLTFKVTSAEAGGHLVMELIGQPGGGPPLHTHEASEIFSILEGEFEFTGLEDGKPYTLQAAAGDTVYIPGGQPHTYKAVGTSPGKATCILSPGADFEGFVREAGVLVTDGQSGPSEPPDIPALIAIANKYGQEFLVP